MAFDEQLAERVRGVLASAGRTPTEKWMFGGLSFLIGGNMCCGVLGAGLRYQPAVQVALSLCGCFQSILGNRDRTRGSRSR
jgi:hypothetical protein